MEVAGQSALLGSNESGDLGVGLQFFILIVHDALFSSFFAASCEAWSRSAFLDSCWMYPVQGSPELLWFG
jgi:hypothetical protein